MGERSALRTKDYIQGGLVYKIGQEMEVSNGTRSEKRNRVVTENYALPEARE